jgi:hypothetical protein
MYEKCRVNQHTSTHSHINISIPADKKVKTHSHLYNKTQRLILRGHTSADVHTMNMYSWPAQGEKSWFLRGSWGRRVKALGAIDNIGTNGLITILKRQRIIPFAVKKVKNDVP